MSLFCRYRGATHSDCNLNLSFRSNRRLKAVKDRNDSNFFIPVVLHNLRGYDSHLILKGYREHFFKKAPRLNCLPNNLERYISFSIGSLRFIDSLQFLNSSLEKLASNLKPEDFVQTKSYWPADKVDLLLRKGVYPYDYMDGPDKMEVKQLPSREDFYSRLTEENVSEDQYQYAQRVWREFGCKNMGQYHDLYLTTDVLILADVFEAFR
jgi:DNA polymerase type B, organellar and viral